MTYYSCRRSFLPYPNTKEPDVGSRKRKDVDGADDDMEGKQMQHPCLMMGIVDG
jgi:hypothetical protein